MLSQEAMSEKKENALTGRILAYITALYILVMVLLTMLRYWGFGYNLVDFGSYIQLIWHAAQGNLPTISTVYPFHPDTLWFSFHFSFLIFIVAPLFSLLPYPELLLMVHVLSISLAVFPLAAACRALGASKKEALIFGCVYLFNPLTLYLVLFNYQFVTFSAPLFAFALWAVVKARYDVLLLCSLLLLISSEHYGASVCMFGALWYWKWKEKGRAAFLVVLGVAVLYLVMFHVMPFFSGGQGHGYVHNTLSDLPEETRKQLSYTRYNWIIKEEDILGTLKMLITSPASLVYYGWLVLPFLGLPFFSLALLLPALPDFMANILAATPVTRNLIFHYNTVITPCLIIASCGGFLFLRKKIKQARWLLLLLLLVNIGAALFYVMPPVMRSVALLAHPEMEWSFSPRFEEVKKHIPPDAVIFPQDKVAPYFAKRREFYNPYVGVYRGDYIIYRLSPMYFDVKGPVYGAQVQDALTVLEHPDWGVDFFNDRWIVFGKHKKDVVEKDVVKKRLYQLGQQVIDLRKTQEKP